MTALFVTSVGEGEGKTALSMGLARWLQGQGKRVGYLKPGAAEGDAAFARKALALEEAEDTLGLPLLQGYAAISNSKDVVFIEGNGRLEAEVKRVGAKVMLVTCLCHSPEETAEAAARWGDELVGVVVNAVPRQRLLSAREQWQPFLEGRGVKVLGFLPEDRTLFAPSVAELAQHLGGQLINQPEKAEELVEDIMVGVLWVDPIPLYFERKPAKAVVARGDRPDVQLGALETPLRCLILTQGIQPHPVIYYRAEDKGVPIMVVNQSTAQTLEAVEQAVLTTRFRQVKKLPRLLELVQENLELESLRLSLGM